MSAAPSPDPSRSPTWLGETFDSTIIRFPRAPTGNAEVALALAEAGLAIFPASLDKRPQPGFRWKELSSSDAENVERWWGRYPDALPAIDCAKSGLVVLDLDRHGDGPDGVAAGEALLGDLHALGAPVTLTRNGGLHVFFRVPPGENIGNATGSLPAGVDVRSRGYVVASGATLPDGTGWRCDPEAPDLAEAFADGTIPELPAHVLALIRQRPERPEPRASVSNSPLPTGDAGERERRAAETALERESAALAATGEGGRNAALNGIAFRLDRMVGAGWIARSTVERALEAACDTNGLVRADGWPSIRKTMASGLDAGVAQPADALMDRDGWDAQFAAHAALGAATARVLAGDGQASTQAGGDGALSLATADPLRGFSFDGDAAPEPPKMLVKGLIGDKEIAFVGGQSGAGKTFVVIDLAVSLASGEPFFGRAVKERVGVAIFAGEGASTIPNRLAVAKNAKVGEAPLPIAWLGDVPDLKRPAEVAAMIPRLRAVDARFREAFGVRLGLVVADTLAATFDLEDENENSEAARTIRILRTISEALGVTVMPVHHFGKATDTGLRGASGWRAGCDTVLAVLANRDQTTGRCDNRRLALSKSRVSEEGPTIPFDLRFVALGADEDGDEFGSCYVEPGVVFNAAEAAPLKKEPSLPRPARTYLNALGVVLGDHGRKVRPFGFDGPEVVAVDREVIRDEFYRSWPADGDTDKARAQAKRQAFKRGEDEAVKRHRVATYEVAGKQMVWFLKEPDQCQA